jgi:hypothetical protein
MSIKVRLIIKFLRMFLLNVALSYVVEHVRVNQVEVAVVDLAASLIKLGRKLCINSLSRIIVKIWGPEILHLMKVRMLIL